jgi:hypothetical protein
MVHITCTNIQICSCTDVLPFIICHCTIAVNTGWLMQLLISRVLLLCDYGFGTQLRRLQTAMVQLRENVSRAQHAKTHKLVLKQVITARSTALLLILSSSSSILCLNDLCLNDIHDNTAVLYKCTQRVCARAMSVSRCCHWRTATRLCVYSVFTLSWTLIATLHLEHLC